MLVVLSNPPELARLRTAGMNNTSQDPDYVGPVGHEKKFHKTHFGVVKEHGGNERVRVKTADGYTVMSAEQAEEMGLEIIPQKRERRRTSAEVEDGNG